MAKSRVGDELFAAVFRDYTFKQWDREPKDLDASVTARIPVRSNFDPRYFSDKYQALPSRGYTAWFDALLTHELIDVALTTDYFDHKAKFDAMCGKIVCVTPLLNVCRILYRVCEGKGVMLVVEMIVKRMRRQL